MEQMHDGKTDTKRQRGDYLKVKKRLAPNAPHLAHVTRARDAEHHRAKNNRADQHFDQRNKPVTHRLERHRQLRFERTQKPAEKDAQKHPKIKMPRQ